MKKILRKIGLLDSFTAELRLSNQDLVGAFSKNVDDSEPELLDIFISDKREFSGFFKEDKFELRKNNNFLFSFGTFAQAIGKIENHEDKLVLKTDVYLIRAYSLLIGFGIVMGMFFLIGLAILFAPGVDDFVTRLKTILGIWTVVALAVGTPLWFMRMSVKNLKYDSEDEFQMIQSKMSNKKVVFG